MENIDLVHPVMTYPTVDSGSIDQASALSDALAPINTPVLEPRTDSGLTPGEIKMYCATFSQYGNN